MSQIKTATGRLIWLEKAGEDLPEPDAGRDAEEHPQREVALEDAHRASGGLLCGDFALSAHAMARVFWPRASMPAESAP